MLSICIPTFNRKARLDDCLNSILISSKKIKFNLEVCISDNNSDYDIAKLISKYQSSLNIKFNKNKTNIGFAANAIKVVSMAKGEFSWLIGDDDLLVPDSLLYMEILFQKNPDVDYFYVNSYHLESDKILSFPKPLDTNLVDLKKLKSISNYKENKKVMFWDVIDPNVSWDFLIGIFVSIFRTKSWMKQIEKLNKKQVSDRETWSTFENTCLHPVLLCEAFKNSTAYICSKPLSINLIGAREWGDLYEFIEIVRIPQLLDYYRSKGLPLKKYLYCKNFALRNFSSYMFKIFIKGKKKGWTYINLKKDILSNLFFPNVYLSFFRFFFKKFLKLIGLKY